MGSAVDRDEPDPYLLTRSELSLEEARLYQTRLEHEPVELVRQDATWKFACAASVLTMPVNYFLLALTHEPLLILVLTAVIVGLAAFFGRQRVVYVCSNSQCRTVNDPGNEWCARCGAKITGVVERQGL